MIRLVIITLFLLFTIPAQAQEKAKIMFTNKQVALLNEAQDYLARVHTIRANFIQVNPGSTIVSSGKILVSKPGKLKMSYAEPYRIDYYINDDDFVQYDYDLDEATRGAAPDNPLKVLLYNDLTLANNDVMNVTNVVDNGKTFNVFLLNKTDDLREISGLILRFGKLPTALLSIERVDNEGNNTQTNLSAITINDKIDDKEFVFKKPKKAFPTSQN